jgi:glycosyltransferase involved in cell wall biosynthesis
MPNTIWIVSELFAPDDAATAHLMTQIAEGLAAEAEGSQYSISVICAQPTYTSRGQRVTRREITNGVQINRCWSTTFSKDRLILRAFNVVTIMMTFFIKMLFRFRRGDRVLVVTNPPPLPFVATLAAKLKGARTYLLIHDIYPDVLVPTGFTQSASLPYRVIDFATRRLYQSVNQIITIGRDMKKLVLQKNPNLKSKVSVITNWADEQMCPVPTEDNKFKDKAGINNELVIQYSGNMGRTHGLNIIAEAAAILEQKGIGGLRWMMCGWGSGKKKLEQVCTEKNLQSVAIFDPVPREDLAALISSADISIISFIPEMSGISVPSRMYNIFAAGCPIIGITEPDSELAQAIFDDDLGWVSPPDKPEFLADLVIQIYKQRSELADYHQRCRTAARTRYTKNKAIRAYYALLSEV